ncbi:UNKNOWN [Stylonychia lemnae]|uniref:Uncharacterized protein n=1 Tax=Stylonychia lemnae TaxID=5949 RepID=A0A078ADN5_STYLE|nr:UNKNOWN [Stylonychia lemnae]|eukprot:CDW79946.1 UNKNOWN [Stylonychia lemnae]
MTPTTSYRQKILPSPQINTNRYESDQTRPLYQSEQYQSNLYRSNQNPKIQSSSQSLKQVNPDKSNIRHSYAKEHNKNSFSDNVNPKRLSPRKLKPQEQKISNESSRVASEKKVPVSLKNKKQYEQVSQIINTPITAHTNQNTLSNPSMASLRTQVQPAPIDKLRASTNERKEGQDSKYFNKQLDENYTQRNFIYPNNKQDTQLNSNNTILTNSSPTTYRNQQKYAQITQRQIQHPPTYQANQQPIIRYQSHLKLEEIRDNYPPQYEQNQQIYGSLVSQNNLGNVNSSLSPIRKHQESIDRFIDTMRQQQYIQAQANQGHQPQKFNTRQIDLFENLEKELKSIITEFNKERSNKKKEIDHLKKQIKDFEIQINQDRELFNLEKKQLLKQKSSEKAKLDSKYQKYRDKSRQQDKEIRNLNNLIEEQNQRIFQLEQDNQSLQSALFYEKQASKELEETSTKTLKRELARQMRQLIIQHKEQSEGYEQLIQQKDKELENLRNELENQKRDIQNSYRSIGDRVVKQSFHFNSSNNNINPNVSNSYGQQNPGQIMSQKADTKMKRQYENQIKEMKEKIQSLEIMLVESERKSKREYDREVGRLRQMLYQQNSVVNYPTQSNDTSKQSSGDQLMPIEVINDRLEKMNINLSNLERKFTFQHSQQYNVQLENTSSNQRSEDYNYDGFSSAEQNPKVNSSSEENQRNENLYSESLETILDLQQKKHSQLNITQNDAQSSTGPHQILTYRSQGTISGTGAATQRQQMRHFNNSFNQNNNMNEELVSAKKQLEQLREDIQFILQKNDINQKSLKKQIINEIKTQLQNNSKRFEVLEQLVFESVRQQFFE